MTKSMDDVTITVTRSAGNDRAVLVFIDTNFEPDGSDGPGLRVLVNDGDAFIGKAYDLGAHHEAESKRFTVDLAEIPYTEEEGPTTPRSLARPSRRRTVTIYHCDHCDARIWHVNGRWTDKIDGTDILGSGDLCPKNATGHEHIEG